MTDYAQAAHRAKFQQELGEAIAEARERRHIKPEPICNKLGCTLPTWSRLEGGTTAPSLFRLFRIAEVLNVQFLIGPGGVDLFFLGEVRELSNADLILRFWDLPLEHREAIALELELSRTGDEHLPTFERCRQFVIRAQERRLSGRLSEEISKLEDTED